MSVHGELMQRDVIRLYLLFICFSLPGTPNCPSHLNIWWTVKSLHCPLNKRSGSIRTKATASPKPLDCICLLIILEPFIILDYFRSEAIE